MAKATDPRQEEEEFKPRGTIVILILYMLVLIGLWGSVYLILLQRGMTI